MEKEEKKNHREEKERFVCEENEEGKLVCEPEENSGEVSLAKKEGERSAAESREEETKIGAPEIETKKGNIFIGTLNVMSAPAKALARPLVKHYKRKYHDQYIHAKKLFALDMVLLLAIAALIIANIYFFFGGGLSFLAVAGKSELGISYNQERLTSGEETEFTFTYLNKSKDNLNNASLTVSFPRHFEILSYEPEIFDARSHTLEIGSLAPAANGRLKIKGIIYDELYKPGKIIAVLNYMAGKRKGSDSAYLNYNLSESVVGAEAEFPETAVKNQQFSFNINYYNNSSFDLAEFLIAPDFPPGFKIISSSPARGADGRWHLSLAGKESGKIYLTGVISAENEILTAALRSYLLIGGDELLQKEDKKNLEIINPRFAVELSSSSSGAVNLGGEANYKITYKNGGDFNLRNISFELGYDDNFIASEEKKIFDYKTNPELALARPGSGGEINFTLRIKNSVSSNTILEGEPLIKPFIKVRYILEDTEDRDVFFETAGEEKKINTNLSLSSFARYYASSGEQLGRGSLPPEVGIATKYWIFWYPLNNLSDAEEVIVTASLADNVEFTGASLPLGVLDYNPAARTISWNAGRVNKYNGKESKGLSFEIAFIPKENQVGSSPELITDIKISGRDTFTGENISAVAENISTDLPYDNYLKLGDSKVVSGF